VEKSVNAILASIDDFLKEAGTRTYRALAGLERRPTNVELLAVLNETTHGEVIAFVRELSTSTRIDATKKHRVERLLANLLEFALRVRLAPHDDALSSLLATTGFQAAGKTWTLAESLRDGWTIPTHEARALVATERSTTLFEHQSPFSRRVDAIAEAAPALGATGPRALLEAIERRTFAAFEPKAGEALKSSDDSARDLTAFALKRLDPQLKPTNARTLDLARALAAPWFFEVLRREDLSHAVSRTVGELGFDANAFGRILIDAETEKRAPGAHLVRVEVPDQLRLVLTASPGFDGYAGWLGTWGEAQVLAAVPKTLPFIDRVIGDGALVLATRRVFESILLEEQWLKRALRATSSQAKEIARLAAWRQLMHLREELALLPLRRELVERGAVRARADDYLTAMERAHFVQPERGRFLLDGTQLGGLTSLDAWALEAVLSHQLRERFNEDWWRNPAAGRFVSALAGRGTTDDATQVAASLGHGTLELSDAVRRRIVIMGA
jgi:hypothetical protein